MSTGPKMFDWKPAFLKALTEYPVVRHGCEAVDINRSTAWRARETDPEFAKAWDEAMEAGIDRAEQEAFRRGMVGFEEPVIDKGKLVYQYVFEPNENGELVPKPRLDEHGQPIPLTVRKHSDALLNLVLKGRRKKVYADRTELTGAEGAPVALDSTVRASRVAHLVALAEARKEFGDLA